MLNGHVKPEEQAEQPVDEQPDSMPEQQFANGNEDYEDLKARLIFFGDAVKPCMIISTESASSCKITSLSSKGFKRMMIRKLCHLQGLPSDEEGLHEQIANFNNESAEPDRLDTRYGSEASLFVPDIP